MRNSSTRQNPVIVPGSFWAEYGRLFAQIHPAFSYFFHTDKKKAPTVSSKCLKSLKILVGSASFELATPAV